MPFNVTVEEPDTGIIGREANYKVRAWTSHEGVAAHWDRREGDVGGIVCACVIIAACDCLEGVPVEVERVFPGIEIVEDDVDCLVLFKEVGVCVWAVDGCLEDEGVWGVEDGEESWDFGTDVCDAVDEGARGEMLELCG